MSDEGIPVRGGNRQPGARRHPLAVAAADRSMVIERLAAAIVEYTGTGFSRAADLAAVLIRDAQPPGTRLVAFRWATGRGDCSDCGRPALYQTTAGEGTLLCPVCAAARAADGEEIILAPSAESGGGGAAWLQDDEWLTCVCGNRPDMGGFSPCLADGTRAEPVGGPDGWQGRLYVCEQCGRIIDDQTREVTGYAVRRPDDSGADMCGGSAQEDQE